LLAAGTLLLAMGLRLALTPLLGDRHALAFAIPAAALVSFVCGVRWGLAMALAALLWVWLPWLPPNWSYSEDVFPSTRLLTVALLFGAVLAGRLTPKDPKVTRDTPTRDPQRLAAIPLWVSTVLALLLPLALLGALAYGTRESMTAAVTQRAESVLRVASEHVTRVIQSNELLARQVQTALTHAGAHDSKGPLPSLHPTLADLARERPHVNSLWVIGNDGFARANSLRPEVPAFNYTDREYFVFHRDQRHQTYITQLLITRSTQELFFDVSQRWEAPDGSFLGIVNVTLRPQYFNDLFRELTQGAPSLTVTLLRDDGFVLARWPGGAVVGDRADPALAAGLGSAQPGQWLAPPADGEAGTAAVMRPLPPYPLFVAVTLDRDLMLARWRAQTSAIGAITLLTACALLGALYIAWRRTLDELRALDQAKREADERGRIEEQLRQSQKLEAMGQLTSAVAHDFNNLLGAMQNHVALLAHQRPELAEAGALPGVQRAIRNGEQLTRKLLAFSRRRTLQPQRLDLAVVLPPMGELLRMSLGSAVTLDMDVVAGTPPVHTDPAELELALLNLVGNARAAIERTGRVLIVARPAADAELRSSVPLLAGRRVAVLSVSDDGVGMDSATLERAAQPFFTTKPEGRGTGLGLAQVDNLCQQAGGALRIDSELGAGTSVHLYLPAFASTSAAVRSDVDAAATAPREPLRGHVLVVDDHRELALATAALLEALGAHATVAHGVAAALRALQATDNPVDVVLTDVVLSADESGLTLALQLRREHPQLPVVLTTGHSPQVAAAQEAGFTVLHKPVPPQALAAALGHALRHGISST
jgi:signal transduction histidine kinase